MLGCSFLWNVKLLLRFGFVNEGTVTPRVRTYTLKQGWIVISFVFEQVVVGSDVVVPIGCDIVGDLGGLHLYSHAFHEGDHPSIRGDCICPYYYPIGLIFFRGLIIPLGLFDLRNGISRLWIDI